jgi:hypothetical protein
MKTTTLKKLLRFTFYSLPFLVFVARGKEPRASVTVEQRPQVASSLGKVRLFKSHGAQPASVAGLAVAAGPAKFQGDRPSAQQVKTYVRTQAVERGVDPNLALWIVRHESQFNPRARGDGDASRGLWQISKIYHPEVSDAAAFSVSSSTRWSLERIRSGKVNEWSSYRYCKTLYGDCPY